MSDELDPTIKTTFGVSANSVYLAEADLNGDFCDLFLLAGRYGSRGGFRLTGQGWVVDDRPMNWLTGDAAHLDPITPGWAGRRARQLGIDDVTFDGPLRPR